MTISGIFYKKVFLDVLRLNNTLDFSKIRGIIKKKNKIQRGYKK